MVPISFTLRCVPPQATAQGKRQRLVYGKPVFFHSARMKREANTWMTLLAPHRPAHPLDGPLSLTIRMVYPHLASTAQRDRAFIVPKITKPDAGNASKHLEDLLTRMGFIQDDARISRLVVEKWHGPEDQVGIGIEIAPMGAASLEG